MKPKPNVPFGSLMDMNSTACVSVSKSPRQGSGSRQAWATLTCVTAVAQGDTGPKSAPGTVAWEGHATLTEREAEGLAVAMTPTHPRPRPAMPGRG